MYAIRDNRSSDVVIDVLGEEFPGILTSDCYLAYDDRKLKKWLKQKCVGHLLKDLRECLKIYHEGHKEHKGLTSDGQNS